MSGEVRQREPRLELPALRASARDAPCTFRVEGVCIGGTETTVWCHSNEDRHGKGKGLKSHDCFGAFGCRACHDWYDNRAGFVADSVKSEAFEKARDRTLYWLFKNAKLRVIP